MVWVVDIACTKPEALWQDKEVQWKFIGFDVTQIRSVERCVEVPPPEWTEGTPKEEPMKQASGNVNCSMGRGRSAEDCLTARPH